MIDLKNTTVAIVGAGTMGQGIAQVCATAGCKVILFDLKQEFTSSAIKKIAIALDGLIEKGKTTRAEKEFVLGNISIATDFSELSSDFIIEAAVEDLDVKQNIFSNLEKFVSGETILLTNTSSIQITRIAQKLDNPSRFAGLHFFNPATLMRLVEIVRGDFTSSGTLEQVKSFAESIGKQAVVTQDSPGFIVNRVARVFYTESLKILEESVSDHQSIDKLARNSGFRMGPFELMDLIGIDVNLSVTKSVFESFSQESRFRPSRIQQQKVDAGMLGRKSGKGFYDYK
jgi:3-hydroxybutyryl-CoA dehydrogenase